MYKSEIEKRINGLNQYALSNTDKELLLLTISNDYTYNKAIALIDKDTKYKDWYGINSADKHCYKTMAEIEAFIDGLCIGKNTDFTEHEHIR